MTAVNGRRYQIEPALLALAHCDGRGVPLAGRDAEFEALRTAGARDAWIGRIFEGHLNAAQLVARCGTSEQRSTLRAAIDAGELFAVWNTQDDEPVSVAGCADAYVLGGAKTWASGAGSIDRPLITARRPDGTQQMCWFPLAAHSVTVDPSGWRPLGMTESDSFRVVLDGVRLRPAELIGAPGAYEEQPWFYAGALRFVAVQIGAIERLIAETIAYLLRRGRSDDPHQLTRVAEMRIAGRTASHWLAAGGAAWSRFDALPSECAAAELLETVDMARAAVERAALDTIERAVRCVGAHGLVEPEPFGRLVRDLQMYLRQPGPDAALLRVARAAFAGTRSQQAPPNAESAAAAGRR